MHPAIAKVLHILRPTPGQSGIPKPCDDAMTLAFSDQSIRNLASQCTHAAQALVTKAGFTGFVRAAVWQSLDSGVTPEAHLQQQLQVLRAEIGLFDTEAEFEELRRKAKSEEAMPLLIALGGFSASIGAERGLLIGRIAKAEQTLHSSTVVGLQRGLTHVELTKLGLAEPSETTVATMRERVAVIDGQLAQLAAYGEDPLKSVTHLAGLPIPGFDFGDKGGHAEAAV